MPPEEAIPSTMNPSPDPVLSYALKAAIYTMPEDELRTCLQKYSDSMPMLRESLQRDYLVRGKDIVRYHSDAASEDAEDDLSDTVEEGEDTRDRREKSKTYEEELFPITIRNDEFAPRFAECLHWSCKEHFDTTVNKKGFCRWHTG